MGSADQIELVATVELFDNIMSKHVTDTSVVISPALDLVVWVGPQQITEQTLIRHFLWPMLSIDNIQVIEVWTQSTLHAEDTIVNDGSHWKHVEAQAELFP